MGFDFGPRYSQQLDANMIQRIKKAQKDEAKQQSKFKSGTLMQRIKLIEDNLRKYFADKEHLFQLIRTNDELKAYIETVLNNGICAIDTETTSLDPILCTMAGFSIAAKGLKSAYIPINHISYITGQRVPNQLEPEMVKEAFDLLAKENTKLIFHNAKFDIRVIKNQIGSILTPYWDTQVGAAILDENLPKGLKECWQRYCAKEESSGRVDYSSLFNGLPFTYVPIKSGYMYAAGDTYKTYELYEYQEKFLGDNCPQDCVGLRNVFRSVEMPLVPVLAHIEETGVCIDNKFSNKLSAKYNEDLLKVEKEIADVCKVYEDKINSYKFKHPEVKLSDPINIGSPKQVGVLIYDILQIKSPDKKDPRGTGIEILEQIKGVPLIDLILKYRTINKMLSTYIDKMPLEVKDKTGRLHGNFGQTGTVTGRLNSDSPNLQNIPAKGDKKDIRKMFIPTARYTLISGDYSQQEPRILAYVSGDQNLRRAYEEGKDIYSWVASLAYHLPYEECLEFRPDGTTNIEGKTRRAKLKAIVLGIVYSKGVDAIAQDLGISKKEAQELYDAFFAAFPVVKQFIDKTQQMARDKGYVEMLGGRRRRLPAMQLPKYEFTIKGNGPANFDPLFDDDDSNVSFEVDDNIKKEYTKKLDNAWGWKQKNEIKTELSQLGIEVKDNSKKIADAERQCVNSVIQGSAGVMTKLSLIAIDHDEILKSLGYRTLLTVHDEINGECPFENRVKAKDRLCQLMIESAKKICPVPMKVDPCVEVAWTVELTDELEDNIYHMFKAGKSYDEINDETHACEELVNAIVKEKELVT